MPVKDRVIEIREVRAGDLLVNPANFRNHPQAQRSAMEGIFAEVGNIDVLKVVERPEGLMLLDGHLRRDLLADDVVKVAVLDLTDEEAKKALLTFDRLTALADVDIANLEELMGAVATEDGRVAELIANWHDENRPFLCKGDEVLDPNGEWTGMPEFEHEDLTSVQRIVMHFKSHEDAVRFGELVGQKVSEKTRSMWYPRAEIGTIADKFYGDENGGQGEVSTPAGNGRHEGAKPAESA